MIQINIKIPFTKKTISISKYSGSDTCNGNGYSHTTIKFTITTIVGNGDNGARTLGPSMK